MRTNIINRSLLLLACVLTALSLRAMTVSPSQTVCRGTDVVLTRAGSSGENPESDTIKYRFQTSNDNVSYVNATTSSEDGLTLPWRMDADTWFRLQCTTQSGLVWYSDTLLVSVYADITAGTISEAQTICHATQPNPLTMTTAPAGGDGNFTYQWQSRTGEGAWADIALATTTSYSPAVLSETTWYRLKVTGVCGEQYTNEVEITVRPALTAPVISDARETICYGTDPSSISIVTEATGGSDDILQYQWQQSTDGTTFTDIVGATYRNLQPRSMKQTTWFRVMATSQKGCGQIVSSNTTKVTVYDEFIVTTKGLDAPLCYMTNGEISVSATGAGGAYTYQWQESADGTTFTDIIRNGNTAKYMIQGKEGGTYTYRCVVTPVSGCDAVTSGNIVVTVYDDVKPGTLSGAATICYGSTPEALTFATPATGGDGNYTYRWMQKPEGTSSFGYINGATGTSYTPSALYRTTDYQVEVTNACGIQYTAPVRITVREPLTAPVISGNTATICYNTVPDRITVTAVAAGGSDDSFTYQWQQSSDGQNFTNISGATGLNYQSGALTADRWFRVVATSRKGCGEVVSNTVVVRVYQDLQVRITDRPAENLCYGDFVKFAVSATGAGEKFTYQWQMSTNGTNFSNISSGSNATYATTMQKSGTFYYRCIVTSTLCGDSYTSEVMQVHVQDKLEIGSLENSQTICWGEDAAPLYLTGSIPEGAAYTWYSSVDGSTWTRERETSATYTPRDLTRSTYYYVRVATLCDTLTSNSVYIQVHEMPEVSVSGNDSVCVNQVETYYIGSLEAGFSYEWRLTNGYGLIQTAATQVAAIQVLWTVKNVDETIVLRVTDVVSNCVREETFRVHVCNEDVPSQTTVVRKPNSNILVCKEDGDIWYEWGYTDRNSNTDYIILDSNRRYVLLPHQFDNARYDYWLVLKTTEHARCYSRSYYDPANDRIFNAPKGKIQLHTLPDGGTAVYIENAGMAPVSLYLYDVNGTMVRTAALGEDSTIDAVVPSAGLSGIYVLQVVMGNTVETFKLIAQ